MAAFSPTEIMIKAAAGAYGEDSDAIGKIVGCSYGLNSTTAQGRSYGAQAESPGPTAWRRGTSYAPASALTLG
jgi:hypothetical protein